jgi:radical SAM protein with 4Fe4S-binding SPASM domain
MIAGDAARRNYNGEPTDLVRWRSHDDPAPSIAVWEITLRCDLGCKHCGSRAGRARDDELSTPEALDLVHQLAELDIKEVTLIGGEFYLRADWHLIASEISRCGMLCSVVTGARQMSETRVRQAAASGVGKISLSIDGLEATHDAIRASAGSQKAAIAAARRITDCGIDLSVNTQINRLTMPELPGVADLLMEIGARSWMVSLTAAMGNAADRPSLMLQPYHLLYLFPLLATIKREKLDPNGIAFFPGNNVGYFGPLAETLRYGGDRGYAWGGCQAGVASLGVESDGSIKGCPSLPTASYVKGNIRERALGNIASELGRQATQAPVELWGFCKSCIHAQRCRAGCTWTSHVLFGRPGNNPYCHFRTLALAEVGIIEKVEPAGAAPGKPFDFGCYRIVETPRDADLEKDPLIGLTRFAQTFGVSPDAVSLWSKEELAICLDRILVDSKPDLSAGL